MTSSGLCNAARRNYDQSCELCMVAPYKNQVMVTLKGEGLERALILTVFY